MLRKIKLNNKPLSIENVNDNVYFGDSRGYIYKVTYPFQTVERVFDVDSPISSLFWYNNLMFYGTWDGEVGMTDLKTKKSIQITRDIVKCMTIYEQHIFVSIDHVVYILDLELNLVDKLEVPHKVLCFYKDEEACLVGMAVPFLGELIKEGDKFKIVNLVRSDHDTSILSIYKDLVGSSDGKITKSGSDVIFSSTGWIRSIYAEDLFSCGMKVIEKKNMSYEEIYAHEDEVMGVVRVKGKILSIGLDCSLCIFEEEELLDDELREIEELNKLY